MRCIHPPAVLLSILYKVGNNLSNEKTSPAPPQGRHLDNIIYLPGQPGDVLFIRSEPAERMMLMSTYEEFQIILTVALLIVAILSMNNKK